MSEAPLFIDEDGRLSVLRDYNVLDTPPDPRTDVFVRLAADLCDTPISLVSLVDKDRQWFKAAIGVDATETSRDLAFCAHAILTPAEVMVVEDATQDPRFMDNALVTGEPRIRFYAGAPILSPDGYPLGTLCVIDNKPRKLDQAGRRRLKDLAVGAAAVLDLHRSAARLQPSATHDLLTGLANRAFFEPVWEAAVQQAAIGGVHCAVLCLDLDQFKQINDLLGHAGGDTALRAAADRLRATIRDTDMAARLGGDEFAVLLVGASNPDQVRKTASRIIQAFAAPLNIGSESISLRTSIGFAIVPADGLDSAELMRVADTALYRAKAAGRNTIVWNQDPLNVPMTSADALLSDLQKAVESKAFTLNWQPYFDLQSGQACGQEALIRWDRPGHGPISPDLFIPVAEESGLIVKIDAWVLETACREAVSWSEHQSVSVNVSPAMFCSEYFALEVANVLAGTGLAPNRLVLEITERTALEKHYATADRFQVLHDLGVRIALDDFGSGYPALGYLQAFDFDRVKLDRSLVKNINDAPRSRLALAGMIYLARSIGMLICAEGIETEEQLDFLTDIQCDMAQGFLLGRPTPRPQFERCPAIKAAKQDNPIESISDSVL
jgi:diguanylate cyclase (GGDEF)-like protein